MISNEGTREIKPQSRTLKPDLITIKRLQQDTQALVR